MVTIGSNVTFFFFPTEKYLRTKHRTENNNLKKIAFGNKEHITDRKWGSQFIETLHKQ